MLEHRYVMQQQLGRPLVKGEKVHHKNGKRDDNDPDNLELTYTTGRKNKHCPGQRVTDLIEYIVTYHREAVLAVL